MKGGRGRPLTLALTFWLTQTILALEVQLKTADVDQDGCITQVVLVEEESDFMKHENHGNLGVNFWIVTPPLKVSRKMSNIAYLRFPVTRLKSAEVSLKKHACRRW